jgi:hypothetical protein
VINASDLTMNDHRIEQDTCPAHATGDIDPVVSRWDDLVIPKHRRMVVQHATNEAGVAELRLYYDDKEIVFDEPELFAFGETLARQARFTAGDATGWGDGYDWPQIRDLLQHLIDDNVLTRAAAVDQDAAVVSDAVRTSPLPKSTCPVARSWHECEAITQELAGRPIELGYLELILPVYRVAHIALDADQRQVGEANVFPSALRLDVPTEWRTCNLPGTRYQSERPMNVTAMRLMLAHWSQIMSAVLRVRQGYLRRFPEAEGAWTVGHVERLAVIVLAVPTYQLMRQHNRVENGDLHPALSSLFRVTDGVRLTVQQMLYDPTSEPTVSPHQVTSIDQILDYAERTYSFHSAHGVCGGPKAMVREFMQVLLEGRGSKDYVSVALEPAVQAAFDDLDAAIDSGLLGFRASAAVFSLWPAMVRAYERVAEIVEVWPSINAASFAALREGMQAHMALLKSTEFAHETWRASHDNACAYTYQQCGRGITRLADAPGLDILLAPGCTSADRQVEAELQDILRSRFELTGDTAYALVLDLSGCIMDFLLRGQQVLRTAVTVQNDINRLLGREQPKRAMSAADMDVHFLIQGEPNRLPYLIDELERLLAVDIDFNVDLLTIARQDAAA